MNRKNICVVTSSRADFGYFRLILKKIMKSEKLKLSLLVTGIHLLKKYGNTIDLIKNEGIPITKIIGMYDEDHFGEEQLGIAVARGIKNFTKAFVEIKPDILLILGDRFDILSSAIAASTLFIPIAHIHGGDNISKGQIDEQIRHSLTKLSHIHFPASTKSYERIKLLGEEEWRIHLVGSPSIDSIKGEKLLTKIEIFEKFEVNISEELIVCLQHPYTIESRHSGEHMGITLQVLKDLCKKVIVLYPNNDPGSEQIIKEIEKENNNPNFKIYKNLEYLDYLSLLMHASLLIGNSSSGLIESSIFKIPVVNIGDRNKGRESAENVINVSNNYEEIKKSVMKGLSKEFKEFCRNVKNPYGDGKASDRIVKILEEIKINNELLIKKLTYNV